MLLQSEVIQHNYLLIFSTFGLRLLINHAKSPSDQQATQIEDLDTVLPQIDEINAANRGTYIYTLHEMTN